MSRISVAAAAMALTATQVRPPTLMRCPPASTISGTLRLGSASTLTGFDTAPHTARMSSAVRRPGVEHVGAGLLEGLQARDRVLEVRVVADVVLRPRREREREVESPHRLDSGLDALDRMAELVDAALQVVVLDRAAHGTCLGGRVMARAASSGSAPYPFSRSTDTGRSVARSSAAVCATTSSSVAPPSRRPSVNAKPELVLASA